MTFPKRHELVHGQSPCKPIHDAHIHQMGEFYQKLLALDSDANASMELFGFKGKLWPSEAMTLYEMARFAKGEILELGCFLGASTIIMAKATQQHITTIDLSTSAVETARKNFKAQGVADQITVICADGAAGIRGLDKKFSFAFIDHDHSYEAVYSACMELPRVMEAGSHCYFHDFQDERNFVEDPKHKMGVYQGVKDALEDKLEFVGYSGCGAIFKLQCVE